MNQFSGRYDVICRKNWIFIECRPQAIWYRQTQTPDTHPCIQTDRHKLQTHIPAYKPYETDRQKTPDKYPCIQTDRHKLQTHIPAYKQTDTNSRHISLHTNRQTQTPDTYPCIQTDRHKLQTHIPAYKDNKRWVISGFGRGLLDAWSWDRYVVPKRQ